MQDITKLRSAYRSQKFNAKWRGIPFLLSFEEWLNIWQRSGHLHERGRWRGKYVMARFGDCGPYAGENVKIISFEQNASERVFSVETRAILSQVNRGKVLSPETKAKVSAARRGRHISPEHAAKLHAGRRRAAAERRAAL